MDCTYRNNPYLNTGLPVKQGGHVLILSLPKKQEVLKNLKINENEVDYND